MSKRANRLVSRSLVPALAAAMAFAILFWVRHYPIQLAGLAALAIGAFTYALRRTSDHVRASAAALRQPYVDPEPPTSATGAGSAPRPNDERRDEQPMNGAAADHADQR